MQIVVNKILAMLFGLKNVTCICDVKNKVIFQVVKVQKISKNIISFAGVFFHLK
jgi:hypothetical protein